MTTISFPSSFLPMQQSTTSNFLKFLQYGAFTGFLVILCLIFKEEYMEHQPASAPNTQKTTTTADYFTNDQPQQYFKNSVNDTLSGINSNETVVVGCDCPSLLYSTENITLVRHGENTPVFVPESLSPMLPDILDKLYENRHDDQDNGILITIAGYAMRHELYNWIEFLKEAKEERFVIFCTDLSLYTHLIVTGLEDKAVFIPDDWFVDDLELFRNTSTNILDNSIPRLSHVKTWVLQRLAYTGGISNVLYLDVNQIMLHARTREYIQTLLHIRWDTQLIATQDTTNQHIINTGLMMIRTDAGQVKRLIASALQIQETYPQLTQQEAFNSALEQLDLHVKSGITVLLDIIHFPNGVNYFENNLSGSRGIEPYIVHANHKVNTRHTLSTY